MEVNADFSPRAQEDFELVKRAVNEGDQVAFAGLMERYRDSIYYMILKMVHNRDDADDLTIEAFGKAFQNLHKYSPDFAFSTWLFKIALNNSIDFIRKKKLDTFSIDQPINNDAEGTAPSYDLESDGLDPEEKFIKKERKRLMKDVVDKLKPKYRVLIEMRYFKEFSYDEIAEQLELPLGTVKAQLHRAKELLYNILSKSVKDHQ